MISYHLCSCDTAVISPIIAGVMSIKEKHPPAPPTFLVPAEAISSHFKLLPTITLTNPSFISIST